jgi:hypothetical protein
MRPRIPCDSPGGATVFQVQVCHGLHQFLDGNGRVIDHARGDQAIEDRLSAETPQSLAMPGKKR